SPLMRGLTTAVTAIGAGMGMLAKSALTVGGDFEITMKRVSGVIGDAEGSFDALTEKAKKMGEELPITATEAADAMLLLAQAGKKTNDILSIVDDTTALAISQNYGLAETTKLVVSTMSMFGLEAKDSERIVDNFTNACNNSAMTMEKFSNGMSYVGELAQSFGLSLEETTGMLALLSRSGLEGEKMATSLRAILINLRDPTAQASAAFKELGISLTDASGKMKPPVQLLRELAEAGMTVDQAIQIFDRRAIGAGLNLSKFVSELDGTVKKMWETGTTTQRLNELLDTFKNRTKEIASAWEGTLLVVFDQINVKSKAVVQEITALIRAFNEWAREQKVFEKVFNALMEGFGIAVGNVNRFKETLASINVDDIAGKFKGFAEGVRTAYNAFMDFAEKVPWGFLAEHLDKIALTF
ncbi:MAG: phage tail tape measure protein, partial [Clostridia bacterium]|nr:phage tail tape measure protein [Clostridia bacterium]